MPDPVAIDPTKFLKARQYFRFRIGILPQYHPRTGTSHDSDSGTGHTVHFYDVPLLGPNRIGVVGEPMEFEGGVSYKRIGGDVDHWEWRVYKSDSETLGDGDLVDSEVPSPDHHFTWTPTEDGIYRIELRLGDRKSDKSTDGARFIRGHEVNVTYKPLDPGGTTPVDDWARIVMDVRAYYSNFSPIDESDSYDYESDELVSTGNPPSASVLFNGLVVGDSIVEDHTSETVTFKMQSPGMALKRLPMVGYYANIDQTTDAGTVSIPVEYPLMFGDPSASIALPDGTALNVVDYIRQNAPDFPVHEITEMHYSDPIYHILQRHTNFMQWFDVYLEQDGDFHTFPYSVGQGDIFAQLKKFQDSRMGVLYSNKKGVLFFSRDVLFQDSTWWGDPVPEPAFTFNRDNIQDMHVEHNPFRVAQVQISGTDDKNRR
jgi:hypothetical protein